MMKTIALTSANFAALAAVTKQLQQAAADRHLSLSVMPGVVDAAQAQEIYSGGGELWRIGEDETTPELDALVDRMIDDDPRRLHQRVEEALACFLGKTQVAA